LIEKSGKNTTKKYTLTQKGKEYSQKELPELAIQKYITENAGCQVNDLMSNLKADKRDIGSAFGFLKRNGAVQQEASDKLRQAMRERRKERSVDAKEWWMQERKRVLEGGWHDDIRNMFSDCFKYKKFRDQFIGMWQLPEDYNI